MRKTAIILVFFAAVLASRPAEAACRGQHGCPLIIDVFAYGLLAGMIGGYAYGTGYFVYHDLEDETQTLKYGAGELTYNGLAGTLATMAAVDAARDGDVKWTLIAGTFAVAHGTMAAHGMWRIKEEWKDPGHAPDNTREWIAGIAYGANTLVWTVGLANDHKVVFDVKNGKLLKLGKVVATIEGNSLKFGKKEYLVELTDPHMLENVMPAWKLAVRRGDELIVEAEHASSLCAGLSKTMTPAQHEDEVRRRVIYYIAWRELGAT